MPDIRILSVKQPWATLIVRGVKRFEARSWPPRWRGRIAIHASSTPIPRAAWEDLVSDTLVREALAHVGLAHYRDVQALPRSAVVGAATVEDARIVLDWSAEELLDLDAALSSGFPPEILWRLTEPFEFAPITGVDGKLNLWTLEGAPATQVRALDTSGAVWSGAPHDDSEVKDARDEVIAELEYSRDYMHEKVPVPTELRAVLGGRAKLVVLEAFRALIGEVLGGRPIEYGSGWDKQVPVSGPIGSVLFPGRKRAVLRDACEALVQRLTPEHVVPGFLMQMLSANLEDE
jgi:hypothetical protein